MLVMISMDLTDVTATPGSSSIIEGASVSHVALVEKQKRKKEIKNHIQTRRKVKWFARDHFFPFSDKQKTFQVPVS